MAEIKLKFAEIVIALNSDEDQGNFSIPENYSGFITEDKTHIEINIVHAGPPFNTPWDLVLDTGGAVSFFRDEASWMVSVCTQDRGSDAEVTAVFANDNRSGDIYDTVQVRDSGQFPFPLRYPLCQIFMADMLSMGVGMILHACGIIVRNSGMLFAGVSGAGKSTLARLFLGRKEITLLNDDRVILRAQNGDFHLYGTPWHGDVPQVNALDAPLEKIFILNQARENRLIPLNPKEAATALFVRSFPTYWKGAGIEFSLAFMEGLVSSVPCFRLDFLPEPGFLDLIL